MSYHLSHEILLLSSDEMFLQDIPLFASLSQLGYRGIEPRFPGDVRPQGDIGPPSRLLAKMSAEICFLISLIYPG